MKQNLEKLTIKLDDELQKTQEIQDAKERVSAQLIVIEKTTSELNHFLERHTFDNNAEEIKFFKIIKPKVLALKIQEIYKYNLLVNKPIGTNDIQCEYFEDEIRSLQGFFRINAFHYQYFKNNLSDLDQLYFLRKAGPLSVPLVEIGDIDEEYSTPMSYLFGKFMAFEHVQYFMLEQIAEQKSQGLNQVSKTNAASDIRWTGDKANLIELAYGIWLTGQLNDGNANLNEIVRWLESKFGVQLGNFRKRFSEMESRKRLSNTKFLNQMKEATLKKMEDGLA